MAYDSGVTVADVRTALNEVNAAEFPDSTIQDAIDAAEVKVSRTFDTPSSRDAETLARIVTDEAAWRTWTSTPSEIKTRALDLSTTYDAQGFKKSLRTRRDEAWELADQSAGGDSAAILSQTDSVFDDGGR